MVKMSIEHGRERREAAQADEARGSARARAVLALETSTAACSVALAFDGRIVSDHRIVPREHNRLILPMIDDLLRVHGVARTDLDAIAFGRGPGSFTGVRIAAGIAQGISVGLALPVVPVSSLLALAHSALRTRSPASGTVVATIRSRPDETYVAAYRYEGTRCVALCAESIATADVREPPVPLDATSLIVGDAVAHYEAAIAACGCRVDATALPHAASVAELALDAIERGETVEAAAALPVYLHGTSPWRKLAE
jgi:tRNA threonylcarbamoyladenosine biosynthesis protein TsaB